MTRDEAEAVIEQLRYGIPPTNVAVDFTVGRDVQIQKLGQSLTRTGGKRTLLVHANYGAGKTHLLRVVRELALDRDFAVALIVADAQGGVRFNRLDTVFGAICKEVEVPGRLEKGIGVLFDAYRQTNESTLGHKAVEDRERISNRGKWDISDRLKGPGIYAAIRAWCHADDNCAVRDRIKAWLSSPDDYRSQRKLLYNELVKDFRACFRDPRPEWKFYKDEVFLFRPGGHRQSWDGLTDLHRLAVCSGYGGLVLLVDEFEDVIQNLPNKAHQEEAFYNLFRFFAGERFPGQTYFAVTPDFAQKCKKELLRKGVYDFDYGSFDDLPYFRLDPITAGDFFVLARRIRDVHAIAYNWRAKEGLGDDELQRHCKRWMGEERPDKIRQAIVSVVELLDSRVDGHSP